MEHGSERSRGCKIGSRASCRMRTSAATEQHRNYPGDACGRGRDADRGCSPGGEYIPSLLAVRVGDYGLIEKILEPVCGRPRSTRE